jgi:hypothetical protein
LRLILPTGGMARNGFTPSCRGALSQLGKQLRRNCDAFAHKAFAHLQAALAWKSDRRVLQHRGAKDFDAVPE